MDSLRNDLIARNAEVTKLKKELTNERLAVVRDDFDLTTLYDKITSLEAEKQ